MRHAAIGLVLGALLLAVPPPADAQQDVTGRYTISVVGARVYYDNSSALKDSWAGGVEAEYNLKEWFSFGAYVFGGRPTTDGEFFPLVRMPFQDTVVVQTVSQQVTNIDYGLTANFRFPISSAYLRALGGVGGYTFFLDDQRIDVPTSDGRHEDHFTSWAFVVGASAGYTFGGSGAVELKVRDFIYTDFDREKFNLSEPLLGVGSIPTPQDVHDLPEPKSTIHNIHIELAFAFTLGGS